MQKRTTIREVASRAGVSVGTVSRVINGKSVGGKTIESVRKAMLDLGYTPNAVAQSMRTKNTRAIGFVINDISNPLFSTIAKATEKILRDEGYCLLMASTDNDPDREQLIIESLKQRRVDGLIVAVSDEKRRETNHLLETAEFPVVLLDREMDSKLDSVCDDHASGMRKALRYLFDLGHRKIALITGSENIRPGRERVAGFRQAYKERGLKIPENLIHHARFDTAYGYEEAYEILTSTNRPTAIVAGGNQIFSGLMRAVRQLDIRIPEDLSIISCDDIDVTVLMNPPITVIARDMERIGALAGEIIIRRVTESAKDGRFAHVIPTELIVRESCMQINRGTDARP